MVIGDVLKANPAAIKVIQKYFGQGCFTCPGMKMESISFGAMMHNMDPEVIVKELNELEYGALRIQFISLKRQSFLTRISSPSSFTSGTQGRRS